MEKINRNSRNITGDWDIDELILVLEKAKARGADKVTGIADVRGRRASVFLETFSYKTLEQVRQDRINELKYELKKLKSEQSK